MLNIGAEFPDLLVSTTVGIFQLHSYVGNAWTLFCSHPADFTPVCTTEVGRMAKLAEETEKRNVKVLFLSCDSVESHREWVRDIESYSGCLIPFPIIEDSDESICKQLGMFEEGKDKFQTVRTVFVIDPEKKVRATINYPTQVGRNFDEIIRLLDALQLTTEKYNDIVTPADWRKGDEVLVKPGVESLNARVIDMPSGREYLRFKNVQ